MAILGTVAFALSQARPAPRAGPSDSQGPVGEPAAQVAWLMATEPVSPNQNRSVLAGIDPAGRVVGKIQAPANVRSRDGARLYAVSGSSVEVYSALTGQRERTIPRKSSFPGVGTLSPDEHYLGILEGNGGYAVEVIDLNAGQSVDRSVIGRAPSGGAVGWLRLSPDNRNMYVLTDLWKAASMTVLQFDGIRLSPEARATDGKDGHRVAGCDGFFPPYHAVPANPVRLLPDGRTLVACCPFDGEVSWFDGKAYSYSGAYR